jgi:hypothetical protein
LGILLSRAGLIVAAIVAATILVLAAVGVGADAPSPEPLCERFP